MTYQLADYQQNLLDGCYGAWRGGARNVMMVSATGSGKTVVMGRSAHEYDGHGCSIAHRNTLVGQISLALAREGLQHDIVASDETIKTIVNMHLEELGRAYYNTRARWKVASVDTLLRRKMPASWLRQVGLVHMDEGHHVLLENKWGRALSMFDNAYGLLPTASPERADGKGLGRHAMGLVDALVEGPNMRWLIDNGHLTNYHVLMPLASDLDMAGVALNSEGEYDQKETARRVKASTKIVGDVVETYLANCRGMRGITFAVDVEHATTICKAYNDRGVPAVVVASTTPETLRRKYIRQLESGELLQLVNVDLFGEGVDVPAVQVVSMARPTASYSLFVQQFGRALRLLLPRVLRGAWHTYSPCQRLQFIAESAKPRAIIIDHVGNIIKHNGTPDMRTEPWSLDSRERRGGSTSDAIPLRACLNLTCLQPYQRIFPACPYCGTVPAPPADRSRPELVDGDMHLFTPELLAELLGKSSKFDKPNAPIPYGVDANSPAGISIRARFQTNREAQMRLREVMTLALPPTLDERVAARKFFHTYGVDTLTARGLTSADADELRQRILSKITGVKL